MIDRSLIDSIVRETTLLRVEQSAELIAEIAAEACCRVLQDPVYLRKAMFEYALLEILADPVFLAQLLARLSAEDRAEVLVLHDKLAEQGR